MYNHLRGEVVRVVPGRVVLEAGGIGWDIIVPLSTSGKLKTGQNAVLLVHLIVREDAHLLYGFLSEEERELFRTLIGLSGVGAATAIQILSSAQPRDFLVAIEKQDTSFLKRIKGIGEKTAKRIILELKGAKTQLPEAGEAGAESLGGLAGDAVMALEAMGVQRKEALARVEKVITAQPELGLEDIIRAALRG